MSQDPGLKNQEQVRRTARIVGTLLTLGGVVVGIIGIVKMIDSIQNMDDVDDMSGFAAVAFLAVGGFMFVFGLAALNVGFLGASSRYTAGEVAPVLKDTASYLTDGEGLGGVGRTIDDPAVSAHAPAGAYCSRCGTRNDVGAKFCDECGTALADLS